MHADEILFLEEGKIVERGTHEGLLDLGGRYAELHSLQMRTANSVEPTLAQLSPG
jgi:ATP-binding cassette subfamily B protein